MRKTTTTQICHEKKNLIKECNKLVSDINRDVIILIEWAWKILLGEKEIRLGEQQGNRWKESMLRRRRIIDGKCGMRTGCLSQCEYMKSLDTHTHTQNTHTACWLRSAVLFIDVMNPERATILSHRDRLTSWLLFIYVFLLFFLFNCFIFFHRFSLRNIK